LRGDIKLGKRVKTRLSWSFVTLKMLSCNLMPGNWQ